MRFAGQTAVVTGAASGIGRATALRLASEGATVYAADIDEDGGRTLAETSNGRIRFVRTDVTRGSDIEALMDEAAHSDGRTGGRLDVVFNNAGAGGAREKIDAIDADGWDATMALLLRSVALGIRHAATHMKQQAARSDGLGNGTRGAIVNTSSIAALGTGYAPTAYTVAKAGVLHLTKAAAADLAQYGIRVNAICPGFITTNIFTSAIGLAGEARVQADTMIEHLAATTQPVARAGRPEDIAAAVAYLASDDAGFVTGTQIVVDGGLTIGQRHSWDPAMPGLFDGLQALADAGADAADPTIVSGPA